MDTKQESLSLHREWAGKIEVTSRVPVGNSHDLSVAYTPGVAEPCREIHGDPGLVDVYTRRWNQVAVVSDGSAVLGPVSYTHLRAHETDSYLVCRLLLEKKKNNHD